MPLQAPTTWATVQVLPVSKMQADDVLGVGNTSSPYIFLSAASDEELAKYRLMADGGRKGAAKRWAKGGDALPTGEANSPPIHTPMGRGIATKNQEPRTI